MARASSAAGGDDYFAVEAGVGYALVDYASGARDRLDGVAARPVPTATGRKGFRNQKSGDRSLMSEAIGNFGRGHFAVNPVFRQILSAAGGLIHRKQSVTCALHL